VLGLRLHSLPTCDLDLSAASTASLELTALGDFVASNESAERLPLDGGRAALRFPAETLAVEARVVAGGSTFTGYAERQRDGVDVLLWPDRRSCLVTAARGGYPGKAGGQALAYAADGQVLVAGGNDALSSAAIVGQLSFDTRSGALAFGDPEPGAHGVLDEPRAFATLTRFGDDFLVAGGEQPVSGVPELDIEPIATAERYSPALGRFTGERLELHHARTRHAALTLDDGRTLLVGGRTKVGGTSIAQYQLEIVDPASGRASVGDAIAPRIGPTALRLVDGRIFVGGGVLLDGSPAAPAGEWLTPRGKLDRTRLDGAVAPRFDRAFVALEGGGVLAVGGCEDRPPASEADAAVCERCSHGCRPLGGSYDAFWIDAAGSATPLSLSGISAPRPLLVPGSDGRPWLIAATERDPEAPALFRFDPWSASFDEVPLAGGTRLPRPGMPAPLTLEPDTFLWLDDEGDQGALFGLRLGARSRYAQDVPLILLSDPLEPSVPLHLVPTAAPSDAVRYTGLLELNDPAVSVRVADTDYAELTLRLRVRSAALPVVLLGDAELGGRACPWPSGERRGGDFDWPILVRSGSRAQLRFHGETADCDAPSGRVTVALRAGPSPCEVSELAVLRTAEP
jgi:hypothetical protein